MIKAILFDFDGVILDNTEMIIEAFQEDARRAGLEIPDKKSIISYIGTPWQGMVEGLLGKDDEYKKIHLEVWSENKDKVNFTAGLEATLEKIKGLKGVVTSGPADIVIGTLKKLSHNFDCVITAEDTTKHKPDPEPLLKACGRLKIKPEEAIYIGDHLKDFEAANNAGMKFIGLISGATTKDEFKQAGAEKIIDSVEGLLDIV